MYQRQHLVNEVQHALLEPEHQVRRINDSRPEELDGIRDQDIVEYGGTFTARTMSASSKAK
jgi:hypothetical protein